MPVRFLDRIDLAIASASTDEERNLLFARKATYLARVGEFSAANEIISRLRGQSRLYEDTKLSVYLTFADGIVAFYVDRINDAKDRFTRASALSKAADARELIALSSAWLAHLAFGRFDFDCLAAEINIALEHVRESDHDCLARICLVIAETIHLAGNQALAIEWYSKARGHAVELGDESTISSIMYNKTAMEIVNYRQNLIWKGEVGDAARFAVSCAEATDNFDKLVGVVSLGDFTPLLKAQTYSLAGRYSDAESIYSKNLTDSPNEAQARSRCWLLSDRAYCLARLGSMDGALEVAQNSIDHISDSVQVDDLAATHGRLSAVFAERGDFNRSKRHLDESNGLWAQFALLQESILQQSSLYQMRYGLLNRSHGTAGRAL